MLPTRPSVSRALVLTVACVAQTAIGQGPTFGVPAAGGGPPARADTAIAFDAARGRTVLFGDSWSRASDTWEWDGVAWVQRLPATIPVIPYQNSIASHKMAYAPGVGVVLSVGDNYVWNTWVWDGIDWRPRSSPPGAFIPFAGVAYHGGAKPGVLHCGGRYSSTLCETWSFAGSSWTLQSSSAPTRRSFPAAAYCPVTGSTYLVGGSVGFPWHAPGTTPQNEMWRWSGTSWSLVKNLGTPPWPLEYGHAMAWDESWEGIGRFVVVAALATHFGIPLTPNDVMWTSVPHPTPLTNQRSTCAYDSGRQRVVNYMCTGPWPYNSPQSTLRELPSGASSWIDLGSPSPAPSARYHCDMACDPSVGTILFGGSNGSQALADTWSFDGNRWTYRGAGSAPARFATALCYSANLGQVVMFGGATTAGSCLSDTRMWDGSTWQLQTFPGGSPAARAGHDMVYDEANQRIVLFGGWNGAHRVADTWVLQQGWAGLEWTQIGWPASAPPARSSHRMAYDARRQRVVLFGGQGASVNFLGDTWELVGNTWIQVATAQVPPARWNHVLDFDRLRGVVVLIGGYVGGAFADDVWEYNGATWTQRTPRSTKPAAREGAGFTWDDRVQRFVIRGGYSWSTGLLGDTWFYDGR